MATQSETSLKLKALRERVGLSVRGLAAAVGMNASTYATYENNYKRDYLPPDLINKLMPVMRGKGYPPIKIEELIELAGFPSAMVSLGGIGGMEPQVFADAKPHEIDYSRDMPLAESRTSGEKSLIELRVDTPSDSNVFVPRPQALSGIRNAIAFYMPDDSMLPWRRAGEPVFLHPSRTAALNEHAFVVTEKRPEGVIAGFLGILAERTPRFARVKRYEAEELTIVASHVQAIWRVLEWVEVAGFG